MMIDTIILGDALEVLKTLPDQSIDCCVTSPPYYGLRDYGHSGQIGMEETPEQFIKNLVEVFREVRRVLKDDGTLWVNIGDSYAAAGKTRTEEQAARKSTLAGSKGTQIACKNQINKLSGKGLKPKDLIGIPWMLAFALRADGWFLRQDIIWSKPNPMPESVTDRCTKAHEYIFLLSKSARYYYDAEAIKYESARGPEKSYHKADNEKYNAVPHERWKHQFNSRTWGSELANKRSVWSVPTKPYKEAHFATFPTGLITDCIKAGCPEGGIVLDPFMGAGTTALTAKILGRNYVGIELNPGYRELAEKRLNKELGLFKYL